MANTSTTGATLATSTVQLVPRAGHWRWYICGLLFFATTINYVDRQVIGVLAPELQKIIGWNEIQYGWIVSSFQAAYAYPRQRIEHAGFPIYGIAVVRPLI